ncbi:MAG: dihydrolipoyl dehydrogenase [Pseudomonadota bacterium]|nr:dihydrolipoyl dehydrogenase [Pseudomonadota bacterium]
MSETIKLRIPKLGDFEDVEVIEILVAPGDEVGVEDSLITLETDKATMDVPSSAVGKIISLSVDVGDKVNAGDLVATVEGFAPTVSAAQDTTTQPVERGNVKVAESGKKERILAIAASAEPLLETTHFADLVVIGAGPGGYTAAFRAADLGMDVILVERNPTLGGVCLNVGCIPSKALLHAAKVIDDAEAMAEHGVKFGRPEIDADGLRAWKNKIVGRLTGGLTQLAKQRKVRVIHGLAKFESSRHLSLDNGETISFDRCIIAAGSEPAMIPGLPDDPRIVDSTGALELDPIPEKLLVVGGGIIGLEMACVYSALGVSITVVELMDSLMPGTDKDLLRPFLKIVRQRDYNILLGTRVSGMQALSEGIDVLFEKGGETTGDTFDKVLVSVGRRANGDKLAAENAGIDVDERGIIAVNKQMQTNVAHIFAIGDLADGPMLAHKATHEAKVAAEVAAGGKVAFDARTIPSVAYTDPEIAWVGLTETEAREEDISYEKTQIPWAASGRALSLSRDEGFTKLLWEKNTGRVLGGAIVGPNAGDLISEVVLAVEMGADATDIGLTIHPHPTLSETVAFAAEAFDGTLTDLYMPRKR